MAPMPTNHARSRKVLINGRFVPRPITGVERYAWEITRALDSILSSQRTPSHPLSIELLCPPGDYELPQFSRIRARKVGWGRGHLWEQTSLPWFCNGNTLLNLCSVAPLMTRNLLCIHDANVHVIPDNFSRSFVWFYRILLPVLARSSQYLITVSKYSSEQLSRHVAGDAKIITVVPNGHEHFLNLAAASRLDFRSIPKPYVFLLGSVSRNKNVGVLLGLADELKRRGIAVVVAGGKNASVFRASGLRAAEIIDVGRSTDADLAYLYRNALAFAFPSLEEGFGIPPLEAMVSGCPVIASNTSAMPEVLGDAALLCPPSEPRAWLAAILSLAESPELRSALVRRGYERARRFSWPRSAAALLELVTESKT